MKKTQSATTVRCDGDKCLQPGVGTAFAPLWLAKQQGWLLADDKDLCPKCHTQVIEPDPSEEVPVKKMIDAETLRLCLRGWANQMAARFGQPVYLVGSALTDPNARDIDIRIELPDEEFAARYMDVIDFIGGGWSPKWEEGRKKWGEDMAKLARGVILHGGRSLHQIGRDPLNKLHGFNVDLKVEPESLARIYRDKPKERLDTLDLAAPIPPPAEPKSDARHEELLQKIENQKRQLSNQDHALRAKNLALDALHYVWCDGGCIGGVHRYGEHPPLTEEIVAAAERNTKRLRSWLRNGISRGNAPAPVLTVEQMRQDAQSAKLLLECLGYVVLKCTCGLPSFPDAWTINCPAHGKMNEEERKAMWAGRGDKELPPGKAVNFGPGVKLGFTCSKALSWDQANRIKKIIEEK